MMQFEIPRMKKLLLLLLLLLFFRVSLLVPRLIVKDPELTVK